MKTNVYLFAIFIALFLTTISVDAQQSLPYETDFDTYPPTGWTASMGILSSNVTLSGTESGWVYADFTNATTTTGAARVNIYHTNTDWMFSPSINLAGGINTHLDFDIGLTLYGTTGSATLFPDDSVAVVISTDGGSTWSNADTLIVWTGSRGDPISNVGQHVSIDLSSYSGIVKFGFYTSSSIQNSDLNVYIDNFKVRSIVANNLAAKMLINPTGGFEMNTTMPISLNVKNCGTVAQSSYLISYSLDSGATFISQTIATALLPGIDTTIVFSTTIDLSNIDSIDLIATVANTGDQITANDTTHNVVTNFRLPYTENFDSYSQDNTPNGWHFIYPSQNSYTGLVNSASSTHSGAMFLNIRNDHTVSGLQVATLPPIYSNLSQLVLKMWAKSSQANQKLCVGVMTDINDSTTFTLIDTILVSDTYKQYIVNLSAYTGTGKYITFKHPLTYSYRSYSIDDIEVYKPVANDLSLISVEGISSEIDIPAKNLLVSIYNNGLVAQSGIDVSYSIDGGANYITENISATINPGDTLDYVFTSSVTLPSGITKILAAVSNSGDLLPFNDSASISVNNFAIPYIEGFENSTSDQLPDGWTLLDITGVTNAYAYSFNGSWASHTGDYSLELSNTNANSGNLILIMPKDNSTSGVSTKTLKLWLKSSSNQSIIVGVISDITDTNTFVAVDTIAVPSTYSEFTIDFSTYTGTGKYVAFKHDLTAQYSSYYFDDIKYYKPLQNDITTKSIVVPSKTICESTTFEFSAVFNNNGTATQNSVAVTAVITNPNGLITTLNANIGSLAKLASDTITFSSVDVTVYGVYNIQVYSSLATDGDKSNDTVTTSFELVAPLALDYIEDFENNTTNWNLVTFNTSPSQGLSSTGLYHNFYSSNPTASAITNKKIGPITSDAQLVFSYRIKNLDDVATVLEGDKFFFIISTDCGVTFDTIYTIKATNHTPTTNWTSMQFPLTSYVGNNIIIGIKGQHSGNGDYIFNLDNFGVSTPTSFELGNDTTICDNSNFILGMDYVSGYTYLWTVNSDTIANTTSKESADIAGVYTVEVNSPLGTIHDTITITMKTSTACSFTGLASNYCNNEASITLVGTPANGTFSGNGISGSSFDPTTADIGTQPITYTFTNANGCTTTADSNVEVYISPIADMTAATSICQGDSIMISAATNFKTPALFFSMYIEGSGNNKALEVCNSTNTSINLEEYVIRTNYNGSNWSGLYTFPTGATVTAGDVYVIANNQADAAIIAEADEQLAYNGGGYLVGFNGNDVRGLFKIENGTDTVLIDIIGRLDMVNPGAGWDVAGVTAATKDHSLVRKPNFVAGSTDWNMIAGTDAASSQYIVNAKNDFTGIGSHTFNAVVNNDTYLWNTGETISGFYVKPTATTTYNVTISNTHCTETGNVAIAVNAYPVVDLGADQTILWTAGSVTLDAANAGMTYIWSTGETTQTVVYNNSNLTNATANTISVIVNNNGCTTTDTVVITVTNDISISEALNNVNVSIYPNPNNGRFTMAINGFEGNFSMEIVNIAGQVIYTQQVEATSSFTTDIDVSKFATGVYYIKLSNKDGVKINKLIIK